MPSNDFARLNDDERHLVQRTVLGHVVEFTGRSGQKPKIRARVIRNLLLGFPGYAVPRGDAFRPPGVRIKHARIVDPLDLPDSTRLTRQLPVLALEHCEIEDQIDLSSAHLSRLSLAGSNVKSVNLHSARIDGPLDISRLGGFGGDECWIDARGTSIGGDVLATGARLQAPEPRPREQLQDGDRRAALWLAGAKIEGSVRLAKSTFEKGGVSLDGARVFGDVRVNDSIFGSGESDAFNARGATIGGVLYLRRNTLNGVAWLRGVRVSGSVEMSDTTINGKIDEWDAGPIPPGQQDLPHIYRKAVVMADAEIGASVRLTKTFVAHGSVDLSASKIRGNLDARGAAVRNQTANAEARALNATNTEIGANLRFDNVRIEGRVDIAGARVVGRLSCCGGEFSNGRADGAAYALEAMNISVGGNVTFGEEGPEGQVSCSRWFGGINLTGAQIGGDLGFAGCSIKNQTADGRGEAILARRLRVQGSVSLDRDFAAQGAVLLSGATIGRDLRIENATIQNPRRSAIYAKDAEIGDDLTLKGSRIDGHARFERVVVTGAVRWESVRLGLSAEARPDSGARLDLMHARIGTRLVCGDIDYHGPCRIDLTGMRVPTIEVAHRHGWGNPGTEEELARGCYPLLLDGLEYDRIVVPEIVDYTPSRPLRSHAEIPRGLTRWFWQSSWRSDRLIDWLLRTHQAADIRFDDRPPSTGTWKGEFKPQPFRRLTTVLRAQGHEEEARSVAIAAQWATPRAWWSRWLHWCYGVGFGFGLCPLRAIGALFLYVALGAGMACYAFAQDDWMVQTPLIATALYNRNNPAQKEARAFVEATYPGTRSDLECIDLGGGWDAAIYALDTVLPFIPLRQETKCEINPEYKKLRVVRALYTVLGWVITSLALLTLSGATKRFGNEGG